ncbi:MAG: trigger factor [Elusimicrobia bacterium]|nr:trigger factor [Elusimicrobiota bacterium]MBP9127730.1 trigger factor [Elusimicrobiota bacterium]
MFGWIKKQKNEGGVSSVTEKTDTREGNIATAVAPPKKEFRVAESVPEEKGLRVKVKERKGCSVSMSIEVPAEDVVSYIDKAFRRVQSKAKLPGFRPGKAPLEIVKQNFAGAAWEEAVDIMLRESIYEALTQKKLAGVGAPVVEKIDGQPGQAFRFEMKIECYPDFDVKDYKSLALKRKSAQVSQAEIDKRLEDVRESQSKLVLSSATVVEKNHFVVVDYDSYLGTQPVKNGQAKNQLIEMGAAQNVEGFTEGLLGAKDGETREIAVKFPVEHPQKDLAGKTLTFKTTVTAIKEKVSPTLDDDFAKDVGATDLVDLKERIRKEIETGLFRQQRDDLEKQVIEGLLAANGFEVPSSQVEERAKGLTEHLKKFLMERGAAMADWEANEAKMVDKNRPEAERQVRTSYILGKILEKENILVPDTDVDSKIKSIVDASPVGQRAEVESWSQSRRENIRSQMREEKLFDFLIQNAKVTDVTPS